ncbi:endophilin-A3 isoform X3 [Equus przewalskii]|uniref:Endophilin-A3 isoform X3 n=1 Tax=Equus przewalskii TaxID=9798 RepID=A0ABM4KD87_EQUPR
MSMAGLKKQFHKASQLFSEKISGVEGTKLDDEFLDMERKIDVTNKAVAEILSKATEYLQPNPAYRAKLGMLNTVSKIRGQVKTTGYPQTEGLLGDCMLKYGKELGEASTFGSALIEVGESMKLMAEVKDSLDINVKQTFIDPLQLLQDKDLKEIGHHLKKLEGRRLDYDYKKKRVGKIPDEEVRQAVEKFEESKELAERSMFNFLENDVASSSPNPNPTSGEVLCTPGLLQRCAPAGAGRGRLTVDRQFVLRPWHLRFCRRMENACPVALCSFPKTVNSCP